MTYTSSGTSVASFDYDGMIIGKYSGSGSSSKTFSLYDLNKLQVCFILKILLSLHLKRLISLMY